MEAYTQVSVESGLSCLCMLVKGHALTNCRVTVCGPPVVTLSRF